MKNILCKYSLTNSSSYIKLFKSKIEDYILNK